MEILVIENYFFNLDAKLVPYSLTSPFRHVYNTDTSLLQTACLVPEMAKIIHSLPLQCGHLCKADTFDSVPLVSI